MIKFEGSMTALATPFKNGALDEAAYSGLVDYQVENGTSVLVPMGTTGEAVTMTAEERAHAVAVCIKANRGRAKVVAGAGSYSTAETIDSVKRVRELGADGALIVTPYYNKPTQAGLVEHYRAIARAHPGYPLIAYNVPGRTGFDLLPETALRLCEIPEVVALKEATGSALRALDVYEKCGERMTLLSGDDFVVAPLIACGLNKKSTPWRTKKTTVVAKVLNRNWFKSSSTHLQSLENVLSSALSRLLNNCTFPDTKKSLKKICCNAFFTFSSLSTSKLLSCVHSKHRFKRFISVL